MKLSMHARRLFVTFVLVLGGTAALSGPASAATKAPITQAKTIHLFQQVVSRKILNGHGRLVSAHSNLTSGFKLTATYHEYLGNHAHHGARATGSGSMTCVFTSTTNALCTAQVSVEGSSVLANRVPVDFSSQPVNIAVNGGTGAFNDVHGLLLATSVGRSGSADVTVIVAPRPPGP